MPEYLDHAGNGIFQTNYLSTERFSVTSDEESRPGCLSFVTDDYLSKHEQLFGPFHFCRDAKFIALQLFSTGILICFAWSLICLIGYTLSAAFSISQGAKSAAEIVVLLYAPLAHLLISVACFSVGTRAAWKSLTAFCLISNTEMLKDRREIDEVVKEQKVQRSERNYRVFQAMRLIRREYIKMIYPDLSDMNESFNDLDMFMGRSSKRSCDSVKVPEISHKRLKDITVKHILENFKKIGKPGSFERPSQDSKRNSLRFSTAEQAGWSVNIEDMHRLIRMCGGDLDKFESFYLLKRSNYGHVSVES